MTDNKTINSRMQFSGQAGNSNAKADVVTITGYTKAAMGTSLTGVASNVGGTVKSKTGSSALAAPVAATCPTCKVCATGALSTIVAAGASIAALAMAF